MNPLSTPRMKRRTALALAVTAVTATGCPLSVSETLPTAENDETDVAVAELVSETLQRNLASRALSSARHGAWQILHGVLAYGRDFKIRTAGGDKRVVDYLLDGGRIRGFDPGFGDTFSETGRRGLRMPLQPESKVGQGHRDQWLAVLAQADVKLSDQIPAGGHVFLVEDWVRQVEWDIPLNFEAEFSWTLIALTAFRPTDHTWIARDGERWSTADLLSYELASDLQNSACGGTHRLIGIAMALQKRRNENNPIKGVWSDAEQVIEAQIQSAKTNQNPDGSFSTAYLHRPGWVRDLGESLGTTGHVLEFLAIAANERQLSEPWVQRSVRKLCGVLRECDGIDLECGGLYHALHGLVEYQRRSVVT